MELYQKAWENPNFSFKEFCSLSASGQEGKQKPLDIAHGEGDLIQDIS